jgi:RNA polymerase sigma factor (sigma-70 family)
MLSAQPSLATLADAAVLARFIERREEAAFAELVRRHGPAVRAACRRALGASADADDAFQVVFVILARKAATLRDAALLGPWLHTVAVRAANRLRQAAARRRHRERQVSAMPEPALPPPEPNDWRPLLDAAIQRLPERLRVPLVLCELEGKGRAEAARLLGLKEGTLSSRLARAREALRKRLRRAGTAVAGAALTAAFAGCREAVPSPLLTTTTQAALSGTMSAPVAALTQGVLKAMLLTKLKTALLVVLTLAVLSGALAAVHHVAVRAGEAKANGDKETLQGTWEFVSGQMAGKEVQGDEAEQIKKLKFVFKGDKLIAKGESTYTIDPGKKPKEIDLQVEEGPEQERGTYKGIYDLKGDELRLCMAMPNQARPTEFATREGERTMLLQLRRVK